MKVITLSSLAKHTRDSVEDMAKNGNQIALALLAGAAVAVPAGSALAVDSAYVEDITTAATQMIADNTSVIAAALTVSVVIFGVGLAWNVFKRIAQG